MDLFGLEEDQLKKLNTWQKKHDKKCPRKGKCGAIGGRTTYCFTPTSLGTIQVVKCACGEEINLTKFEDW